MFLKKEDIFTIILGLYIMDFGISNDMTDQRRVRVLYSPPNAHESTCLYDWNKPQRFPQQTFWLFSGFEEASESILCVSMGSDEQETPLSGDSLALVWRDFPMHRPDVSDGYPNLVLIFILFQPVFTRLPYPISNSTTLLISETTYYK